MLKSDRFLLAIVVGVLTLVVVAFVLAQRKPAPSYRAEDAADGVAYNYLLALQQGDFARAYRYLSPDLTGYPSTVERFIDDLSGRGAAVSSEAGGAAFRVDAAKVTGDRAVVTVAAEQFAQGGLLGSDTYSRTFTVRLGRHGAGEWRLVGIDGYEFWHDCWETPDQPWCAERGGRLAYPKPVQP